jgi:hypothetical protein
VPDLLDLERTRDSLSVDPVKWIRFLRQYGPIPNNQNMYDEFIRRSAQRAGIDPLEFQHPAASEVLDAITGSFPVSVVLTGTAGDGKTHLCRQVWDSVGGDPDAWQSSEPYLRTSLVRPVDGVQPNPATGRTLHVVRDLSAWVPQRGSAWDPTKEALLGSFSASLFGSGSGDVFLIAGNDGQLIETWRRLNKTETIDRARSVLETLLIEDRKELEGVQLRFFNLSRYRSDSLLDAALDAFLEHPGWTACRHGQAGTEEFFGPSCPIRHNLELLESPQVRSRLRELFALCDHNGVHLPIRQILLLLTNAVLGHPGVKDRLMTAADIPGLIRAGTVARASIYNNIFGGNLTLARRESTLAFEAFDRMGIGYETSNRIDNILIFGDADQALKPYFDRYMVSDAFYGANATYRAAQREYVEVGDEHAQRSSVFLSLLVAQRRGLFFKIPDSEAEDMRLWDLTVFRYAGEYLKRVIAVLEAGRHVERPILSRLVRGLNRIFTGMLVADDRDVLLATSLALSQGRVSRLLEDRISVEPRLGERIEIVLNDGDAFPVLEVQLSPDIRRILPLHLTRYEFLSRVAEGALPNSFSRECYEDLLSFKSQLLRGLDERRALAGEASERNTLGFRLLELEDAGRSAVRDLELRETLPE